MSITKILALVLLLIANQTSQADFIIDKPVSKETGEPVETAGIGVFETGLADLNTPIILQAGKNRSLPDALRAILPADWHAKKKPNVNREILISWDRGWDWVTTLNDVAQKYRLTIAINWNDQTATVLKQEQEYLKPAKVFTVSEEKRSEINQKPIPKTDNAVFVNAPCSNPAGVFNINRINDSDYGKIVKTSGNGVPLTAALKSILPKGWHANKTYDVPSDLALSWDKGNEFPHVLTLVALKNNLAIKVDWKNKTIQLDTGCKDTNTASGTGTDLKNQGFEKANSNEVKVAAIPAPAIAPVATGPQTLFIKGPLKAAAEQVAARWHNKIDWKIDESQGKFVIDYEVRIAGKNLEEDLQTLGEAASNDQLRLKFDTYANNVVKVSQSGDE